MTNATKRMLVIGGMVLALALGMVVVGQTEQQAVSAQSPDGHSLDAADGDPTDAVFVDDDGNVGIGTISPEDKLHIHDAQFPTLRLTNGQYISQLSLATNPGFYSNFATPGDTVLRSGDTGENVIITARNANGGIKFGVGNGDDQDEEVMRISSEGNVHAVNRIFTGTDFGGTPGSITFFPSDGFAWFHIDNGPPEGRPIGRLRISGGANPGDHEMVSILQDGRVGIGTTDPQHKLSVKGTVQATELAITAPEDFPDFVFADEYKLMSLAELEKYISQNRHLPGIPSAEEVEEKGLHVGEMQTSLLQKIEELTLYVIDLKKENDALKEQIEALQK